MQSAVISIGKSQHLPNDNAVRQYLKYPQLLLVHL